MGGQEIHALFAPANLHERQHNVLFFHQCHQRDQALQIEVRLSVRFVFHKIKKGRQCFEGFVFLRALHAVR